MSIYKGAVVTLLFVLLYMHTTVITDWKFNILGQAGQLQKDAYM